MDYARTPSQGRLLVLYGNNGVGKTHCAKAVAKWANHVARALPMVLASESHMKQPDVLYAHWPTLLDTFKSGGWDHVSDCEDCTLLVMDEVGGGHDPSKAGLDKLCRILSKREKKWTLVTTNVLPEAWDEAFDRRVASRLFREAVHADLTQVPDFSTT